MKSMFQTLERIFQTLERTFQTMKRTFQTLERRFLAYVPTFLLVRSGNSAYACHIFYMNPQFLPTYRPENDICPSEMMKLGVITEKTGEKRLGL